MANVVHHPGDEGAIRSRKPDAASSSHAGVAVFGVLVFAVFSSTLDSRITDLDLSTEARQQLEAAKVDLGAAQVPEGVSGKRPPR